MAEKQIEERNIEQYLRKQAKALGGLALKWLSPGFCGVPDRIVILPGGRIAFAELKAPGKKPQRNQPAVIRLLRRLGCLVEVIDSKQGVNDFLRKMGGAE